MKLHLCRDKYKLYLKWLSVEHHKDGTSILYNAYFSGPAMGLGVELQSPDYIDLDFTPQHSRVLSDYHIARLSWFSADRGEKEIKLGNPIVASYYENEISSLSSNDYIVIDTRDHEDEKHNYNLVYKSYIVKETGEDKYE